VVVVVVKALLITPLLVVAVVVEPMDRALLELVRRRLQAASPLRQMLRLFLAKEQDRAQTTPRSLLNLVAVAVRAVAQPTRTLSTPGRRFTAEAEADTLAGAITPAQQQEALVVHTPPEEVVLAAQPTAATELLAAMRPASSVQARAVEELVAEL